MSSGRPSIKTPETLAKIEEAFSLGGNVLQACFNSGVSTTTFYRWCEESPEFKDRIELLKQKPIMKALQTINSNLDDVNVAKWLLSRRHPDFQDKQEIKTDDGFKTNYLQVIRKSYSLEEATRVYEANLKASAQT